MTFLNSKQILSMRKYYNLRQSELAARAGVSTRSVVRAENGLASAHVLAKLTLYFTQRQEEEPIILKPQEEK